MNVRITFKYDTRDPVMFIGINKKKKYTSLKIEGRGFKFIKLNFFQERKKSFKISK